METIFWVLLLSAYRNNFSVGTHTDNWKSITEMIPEEGYRKENRSHYKDNSPVTEEIDQEKSTWTGSNYPVTVVSDNLGNWLKKEKKKRKRSRETEMKGN